MGNLAGKDAAVDQHTVDEEDIMPAGFYSSIVARPEGKFDFSVSVRAMHRGEPTCFAIAGVVAGASRAPGVPRPAPAQSI